MWLWWIVSLVILMASIIFSLYIFYSSYKAMPVKKEFLLKRNYNSVRKFIPITKQQVISSLKLKLQSVEHNSMLYYDELKKLQQRIQTLEKNKGTGYQKDEKAVYDDENWEELYYQLHDEKEKMENELDLTNQKLQEAESLVNELKRKETLWKEKRSELENELNKAHTLQNKIGELQRELEGAAEREQDLQQQLEAQKELYKDFELLQQQYAYIQSEADELRNRIKDINNRDVLLQQKINRLTELESTIEISEYEKMDIRKSIEEIIIENEALAVKLQELQEKLNAEKYA
jgi:DNA repair exonuclease SbcCD ATPase subunit